MITFDAVDRLLRASTDCDPADLFCTRPFAFEVRVAESELGIDFLCPKAANAFVIILFLFELCSFSGTNATSNISLWQFVNFY
jgi:hypothetical protein